MPNEVHDCHCHIMQIRFKIDLWSEGGTGER